LVGYTLIAERLQLLIFCHPRQTANAVAGHSNLHHKALYVYTGNPINEAMTPASTSPTAPQSPTHENGAETKQLTSPPRRPRHMPGDPVHKGTPQAPTVHPVNKPFVTGGPKSLQWTNPEDPRATGVDLKTRLQKAEEGLKKAKQDLDLKTRLQKAEEGLKKAKKKS
jgi:hypothetical protein